MIGSKMMRCNRGASALEFALTAPLLCFGVLAMADIGMQVSARMELDRNVRAGAQAAITLYNPGPVIANVVRAAADDPSLQVEVTESCACDGTPIASCSLGCEVGEESFFYTIEASRRHDGPIFRERTIVSRVRAQVK
jgi:hypothetical protein